MKHLTLLLTCLTPLTCLAQVHRVAIYDFESHAVRSDAAGIYGDENRLGGIVANRIMSKLLESQGFEVIDRQQIDNIMREQNLKFSDRFDPRDAPRLGKILHVDAIVVGSVDALAASVKNSRYAVGKLGIGGAESSAQATISMRVISTETGRIFLAESVDAKGSHSLGKTASLLGRAGGGENAINDAHPEAMAATAALEKGADELAAKIIERANSLPSRKGTAQVAVADVRRTAPAPATDGPAPAMATTEPSPHTTASAANSAQSHALKIGRIDGNRIYIIGGENDGLKVNEAFEVRHVTGSMKDDSGNLIETDEKVDTIVITDVEDKFAVARSTSASPAAAVGDRLKPMKRIPVTRGSSHTASTAASALPAPVQRQQ